MYRFSQAQKLLSAQRLAPARTRTRVVRLGAQCADHWTTEQSRGVGVPAVHLTTHVKSSTLYGRTVVHPIFFRLDGLSPFCIIMGLRSASSAIMLLCYLPSCLLPRGNKLNARSFLKCSVNPGVFSMWRLLQVEKKRVKVKSL